MPNTKLIDWRPAKWAQNAVYSLVNQAKILTGYAPNDIVPSAEHNELFNQATVAIGELQTAGTLFYNDQLSVPAGCVFSVMVGGVAMQRQAKTAQPAGFNPDPAMNANILPFPNPLSAAQVSTVAAVDSNTFPAVDGATVEEQIAQLTKRTASLKNYAGQNLPIGALMHTAAETAAAGWLMLGATNQIVTILQYPEAFAVLGTRFGGNGTTTFGIPSLEQGHAMLQRIGATIGSATAGDVKAHTHSQTIYPVTSGSISGNKPAGFAFTDPTPDYSYSTQSTGGSKNLAAGNYFPIMIKMFDVLSSYHQAFVEGGNYLWPERVVQMGDVSGTVNIDFSAGTYFAMNVTGDVLFTSSNVPAPGLTYEFGLKITNGGAHSVTWPTGWTVDGVLAASGLSVVQGYIENTDTRAWVMYAASDAGVAALEADLANETDPLKGAALIGTEFGRTVASKLKDIISTLDLGCDPTGTEDCAALINAKILSMSAAGGGVIVIPANCVHLVSRPPSLRSGVFLIGSGPSSVIYNPATTRDTPASDCIHIGYGYEYGPNGEHFDPAYDDDVTIAQLLADDYSKINTENCGVANLTVRGRGLSLGIWAMNARNVTIRSIWADQTLTPVNVGNDAAAQQAGCADVIIRDIYQVDGTNGVWYDLLFVGASRRVNAKRLHNNISLPSQDNACVVFNHAYDWVLEADLIGSSAKRAVTIGAANASDVVRGKVVNSNLSKFGQHIYQTCSGVQITGNTFIASTDAAIREEGRNTSITNNTFIDNATDISSSAYAVGNTYALNKGLVSIPHDSGYCGKYNRLFSNGSLQDVPDNTDPKDAVNGWQRLSCTPIDAVFAPQSAALLISTGAIITFAGGGGGAAKLYFKIPENSAVLKSGTLNWYANASGDSVVVKLVEISKDSSGNSFTASTTLITSAASAAGDINAAVTANSAMREGYAYSLEVTLTYASNVSQYRNMWFDVLM